MADPQVKDLSDVPEAPEKSVRMQRREDRADRLRAATEVARVRVAPASDELRSILKHPRLGGFRSSGSIEWPLDTWTKRRIAEGSITVETTPDELQQQSQSRQLARQAGVQDVAQARAVTSGTVAGSASATMSGQTGPSRGQTGPSQGDKATQ